MPLLQRGNKTDFNTEAVPMFYGENYTEINFSISNKID